ncbi:MAG: helix-turn-helix domain-containing protein [Bacteroidia bacterium]|nr:helix-turn-helix domain-containing protein [Bacteroidia bacterium]
MDITLPVESLLTIVVDSIGVVLAILLGILLIIGKNASKRSARLLGILLLVCGLTLANDMLLTTGISNRFPSLYFIPINFSLAIGPLFYFFVRSKFALTSDWKKFDFLHFVLPGIQFLVYLGIGFSSPVFKSYLREDSGFPLYLDIESLLIPFLLMLYALLTRNLLAKHKNVAYFWSKDLLKWMFSFSKGLLLLSLVEVLSLVVSVYSEDFGFVSTFSIFRSLFFTGFVYWVVLNGFKQHFVTYVYASRPELLDDAVTPLESEYLLDEIRNLMVTEKLFLNPDLNLNLLAAYMGKTEKKTARIIVSGTGSNFSTFINNFRVEEFKKRIEQGDHFYMSLISIAYSCGFDSKSNFTRIFKQITGEAAIDYAGQYHGSDRK